MAKTAKVKKRQVNPHSRAARRAASPSLNLDKSAQKPAHPPARSSVSPSRPSSLNPHALAAKDAGIIKKQKKGTLTRAQRLRQQKGLERAADNMDKLELKRIKSFGRERKVKERAKGWEDVNGEGGKVTKRVKDKKEGGEVGLEDAGGWVSDEGMEVEGENRDGDVKVEKESVAMPVEEDELL